MKYNAGDRVTIAKIVEGGDYEIMLQFKGASGTITKVATSAYYPYGVLLDDEELRKEADKLFNSTWREEELELENQTGRITVWGRRVKRT